MPAIPRATSSNSPGTSSTTVGMQGFGGALFNRSATISFASVTDTTVKSTGTARVSMLRNVNPLVAATVQDLKCKDYVFLAARGSGENKFDFASFYERKGSGMSTTLGPGLLGTDAGELFFSISQDTQWEGRIEAIGVLYDADTVPLGEGLSAQGLAHYIPSAESGRLAAISLANSVHAKCPNSQLILSGWSQGAWAVSGAVRTADEPFESAVAALLLIADPNGSNQGGQVFDPTSESHSVWDGDMGVVGAATLADWIPRIGQITESIRSAVGIYSPIVNPSGFGAMASKVIPICIRGDIVCDTTNIASLGLGSDIHYSGYGGFYAVDPPAGVKWDSTFKDDQRFGPFEGSKAKTVYAQDLCYQADATDVEVQCPRADLTESPGDGGLWEQMTTKYYLDAYVSVWNSQGWVQWEIPTPGF